MKEIVENNCSERDFHFFARKLQIKLHKHCKTVNCAYAYLYILLQSHAQVLLDRTGAPGNLWVLAQDYLSHIHNLSLNHQLKRKIPEQISRKEGGIPDISQILMFYWFEPVLYLDPASKFRF
jgi:hypothetical protein